MGRFPSFGTAGLLAWAGIWALGEHLAFASLTVLVAEPIGAAVGWLA